MLWDFIVVGGGLTGSVVSSRLAEYNPTARILLVEAGINANHRQDIVYQNTTNGVGGEFDWNYTSVAQEHLNGRQLPSGAGKGLGGGTLINGAAWVRGDTYEYDAWAAAVSDPRWSYSGQLPYMRRTESFFTNATDPAQHGLSGPVAIQSTLSGNRTFPMREPLLQSWTYHYGDDDGDGDPGVAPLPRLDHNAGNPLGMGDYQENRDRGRRQQSSLVYPLEDRGVTVLTEALVQKVLLIERGEEEEEEEEEEQAGTQAADSSHDDNDDNSPPPPQLVAIGIQLRNGTRIYLDRHHGGGGGVILAAGAYRTPQLLMLSGIGPSEILTAHEDDIPPPLLPQPHVGRNLHDHPLIATAWTVRDPSGGWAVESRPDMYSAPQYGLGLPIDWYVGTDVPDKKKKKKKGGLAEAMARDRDHHLGTAATLPFGDDDALLDRPRMFASHTVQYSGASASGDAVLLLTVLLLGQARGSVGIASGDVLDDPVIDADFLGTETDRYVAREMVRMGVRVMTGNETVMGREVIRGEAVAEGKSGLTVDSTDEEIDERVREATGGCYHPAGTAAMGKVVDSSLRVKGVEGLRVVDASVLPHPISANLQVALYALAEQAAEIISEDFRRG